MDMPGRTVVAIILIVAYGLACALAFLEPQASSAYWLFGIVSLAAAPFVSAALIKRMLRNLIVGIFLIALGTIVLPLMPVILVVLALFGAYTMSQKFKRFAMRLPFLLTSIAAYCCLGFGPQWVRNTLAESSIGYPLQYLWAFGLALAGAGVLLLIMGICALLNIPPATTLFFTVGFGWYFVVFVLTFFLPDVAETDGDDDGYGDDEVDWRLRSW